MFGSTETKQFQLNSVPTWNGSLRKVDDINFQDSRKITLKVYIASFNVLYMNLNFAGRCPPMIAIAEYVCT